MDTQSIWTMLADIKIGTLVAWGAVIIAIIAAVVKGIKSLYTFFNKYKTLKEINEKQTKTLEEHEETLKQINDSLKQINQSLNEQKNVNLKLIRHILVDACYEVIKAEETHMEKLASIEDMYEEYVNVFHGNSYVTGLVNRVRSLPIVGDEEK